MRIADAARVRLGAHLAAGTMVMHEGFCNFNAGTLGTSMVEGRISQGVIVGDGSDIGGGASIMGTLSGGGTEQVTIGERCLLGANTGIGISLGDDCVVEAGLYVTAGTLVKLPDGEVVKGTRAVGHQRDDVHPPQPDRRRRGPSADRIVGRPQRGAAPPLIRVSAAGSAPLRADPAARTGMGRVRSAVMAADHGHRSSSTPGGGRSRSPARRR